LTVVVETRPRRDVGTSRDRLETETSRPRPQPWIIMLCTMRQIGLPVPVTTHWIGLYKGRWFRLFIAGIKIRVRLSVRMNVKVMISVCVGII